MRKEWRLIISKPESGAFNMAADEFLLISAANQDRIPCLRFYSWDVPTLSFGYAQNFKDVDFKKLEELHWGLVRRPTGGRAILHTDEVTYSITAPLSSEIASGSLLESYQRISRGLVRGLSQMGLSATANKEYDLPAGTNRNGAVCFEVPSNYEITVDGKKLIGSAQARKQLAMLQHGSLPLYGDLTRINRVLVYKNDDDRELENRKLLDHACTIESITGRTIGWEEAVGHLKTAFKEEYDLRFQEEPFSQTEIDQIMQIAKEKYASDIWTLRI